MTRRRRLEGNPYGIVNKSVTKIVTKTYRDVDGQEHEYQAEDDVVVGSIRNWLAYLYEKYKHSPHFESDYGRNRLTNVLTNAENIIKLLKKVDKKINRPTRTIGGTILGGGISLLGITPLGLLAIPLAAWVVSLIGTVKISSSTVLKQRIIATVIQELDRLNRFEPVDELPAIDLEEINLPDLEGATPLTRNEIQRARYRFAQDLAQSRLMRASNEIGAESGDEIIPSDRVIEETVENPVHVAGAGDRARAMASVPETKSDSDDSTDYGVRNPVHEALIIQARMNRRADFGGRRPTTDFDRADREARETTSPLHRAGIPQTPHGGAGRDETPEPRTAGSISTISPLAVSSSQALRERSAELRGRRVTTTPLPPRNSSAPTPSDDRNSFNPLNALQRRKKGGIVKGKKNKPVPIIAHEGELVVPKKNVPAVLQSSAWKRHIEEIARKKKMTFAQAKQYALGNRMIVKKSKAKPKRKSYMSESSESDW